MKQVTMWAGYLSLGVLLTFVGCALGEDDGTSEDPSGSSGSDGGTSGGSSSGGGGGASSGGSSSSSGGRSDGGLSRDSGSPGDSGAPRDSGAPSDGGSARDAGPSTTWVSGDLPDYQWDALPASSVPWSRIDQLNIGMMWPMSDGSGGYTLGVNNWETGVADPLDNTWRNRAMAYTVAARTAGVKITCLLGGAQGNPNPSGRSGQDLFALATDTDAHAAAFAQSIKTVLTSMNFDGVDLDWEDGSASSAIMYAGLVRLAHAIRVAWPSALLIIPTGPTGEDAQALAPAKDDVDAFDPMSYLDALQWGGWALPSPLSPLHTAYGNTYSLELTLQNWIAAGVPASKVFMGVGGYGAAWTDSNGDGRAPNTVFANATNPNSNPEGESGSAFADNIVTQAWLDGVLAAHPELTEKWDDTTKSSYWGAPAPNQLVSIPNPGGSGTVRLGLILYETPRSIGEKAAFVKSRGMRGISFWTLAELISGSRMPVLDAIP